MAEVIVPARFRGPPTSVNGGYACGVLATALDGPAEITLRAPPPIDTPMVLVRDGDRVTLHAGGALVAEGAHADVRVDVPAPVSWDEASAVAAPLPDHMLPSCFVCGPGRAAGDGLRLFMQPVPGRDVSAAPITLLPQDCEGGLARPEIMWAMLDCPSGLPLWQVGGWAGKMGLLGRLAGHIYAPLEQGKRYVAMGWITGQEGRKGFSCSALVGDDGRVHAAAHAVWIQLR